MGDTKRRIERIERALASDPAEPDDGFCHCQGPTEIDLRWADDEPDGPVICPVCGRPVKVIQLTWGDD